MPSTTLAAVGSLGRVYDNTRAQCASALKSSSRRRSLAAFALVALLSLTLRGNNGDSARVDWTSRAAVPRPLIIDNGDRRQLGTILAEVESR